MYNTGDKLGTPYTAYGKHPIVLASNNNGTAKYSKYSGILEWANSVYLWVNLGLKSANADGYENTFLDQGKSFVWFGCKNMMRDSVITQKILRISSTGSYLRQIDGTAPSSSSSSAQPDTETTVESTLLSSSTALTMPRSHLLTPDHPTVLLFVRLPNEPYCCLGPVEWVSCNFDRHPIVIHWRLCCYDELKSGPGKAQFERILQASPMA